MLKPKAGLARDAQRTGKRWLKRSLRWFAADSQDSKMVRPGLDIILNWRGQMKMEVEADIR